MQIGKLKLKHCKFGWMLFNGNALDHGVPRMAL
jgi:hypothetical protein